MTDGSLTERVAVVTGAAEGLGPAIAGEVGAGITGALWSVDGGTSPW
ncbi:hypothetical protein GCM10010191_08270 [Actinomadura vinacea]|uniref:Short-chain dehydrogenase n=1 Tax=Actinomadura vinacea TaxID=115336 RepID=A0ABN3IF02_9ACTN